jgi:hypothetical protein
MKYQQRQLENLTQNHQKKWQMTLRIFFNTSVSQFMICVNELTAQGCHSRAVLNPLLSLFPPRTISRGIMVVIRK